MLNLSKRVDYALMALVYLSECSGRRVTGKEISKKFGIPFEVLGQILPKMVRKRLISSVSGPSGGYVLRVPLASISVLAVIQAVDGGLQQVKTSVGRTNRDTSPFNKLIQSILDLLHGISVEQLRDRRQAINTTVKIQEKTTPLSDRPQSIL